jgi:predicted phage terminase large subunit-like protein
MTTDSKLRILRAILRQDFVAFIEKVFAEICPGERFLYHDYVAAIAYALMALGEADQPRLIVNLPPRSLKSIIISVAFPAWILGHDPTRKIICASYSEDLARKFARDFRRVVDSRWYRDLFPGMRLSPSKASEGEMATTRGGFRLTASIGSTLTGRGGHYLIIDDPLKPLDAESDSERARANEWFDSTAISRLDDKRRAVVIVAMQRLHQDDLTGHLLGKGGYTHLSLPAIATSDENLPIGKGRFFRRSIGEALHPERDPLEALEGRRREIGSRFFSAQYQQAPVPAEGAMFKVVWLKKAERFPARSAFEDVVQSWDIATKTGSGNDWSVCTTWGILGEQVYLIDLRRVRLEFPELRRLVLELHQAYRPSRVLIEDANTGSALVQTLEQERVFNVVGIKPTLPKQVRASQQTAIFEAGRVLFPANAHWLGDFEGELLAFPNGKHDDQVDSAVQFLAWYAENQRYQIPPFEIWSMPRSDPWPDFGNQGF